MAALKHHGIELGRIEKLAHTLAYFSDGKVLRNDGSGWKLYKKVKDGIDPVEHWAKTAQKAQEFLAAHPKYVEFRDLFHKLVSRKDRFLVLEGLKMLGNDVDGLTVELQDHGRIHLDLEEVQSLVTAYEAYYAEALEAKAKAKAEAVPPTPAN